jgi:UDP:flavonoid glycosyltransferase YjiC (YdhE family)
MANILFAWELGGAYGHLGRMLPVARALRERGHDVRFALRELTEAQRLLGPTGFRWYQAPLWTGRVTGLPPALNHAELLMKFGFLNARALLGVCRAWRNLFELLAPDLVVFDYAPTALLASRGLGMARLNMASGFYVPPRVSPLPPLRWWEPAPPARLRDSEQRTLAVANQVLHDLGAPITNTMHDILTCPDEVFTMFRDMDHFGSREGGDFVGPIDSIGPGEDVAWPTVGARRIFGYLKPDYGPLDKVLEALDREDASVVVHIPGVPLRTQKRFTNAHMRITENPVDMGQASASSDAAVLHSGTGTGTRMLLAGKPVVLFPQQLEQAMLARVLQKAGLAAVLDEAAAGQFPRLLKRALTDSSLVLAAQAFAQRHRDHDAARVVVGLADRCDRLLGLDIRGADASAREGERQPEGGAASGGHEGAAAIAGHR